MSLYDIILQTKEEKKWHVPNRLFDVFVRVKQLIDLKIDVAPSLANLQNTNTHTIPLMAYLRVSHLYDALFFQIEKEKKNETCLNFALKH